MVQVWLAVTTDVGIEKLTQLAANGTETFAGGCAAELSLEIPTPTPPRGAVPVNVTVADTFRPPSTLVGVTDNADTGSAFAGSISSVVVSPCAVIVTVWTAVTDAVGIVT